MQELDKDQAIAALVRTGKHTPESATQIVEILFSIPLRREEES